MDPSHEYLLVQEKCENNSQSSTDSEVPSRPGCRSRFSSKVSRYIVIFILCWNVVASIYIATLLGTRFLVCKSGTSSIVHSFLPTPEYRNVILPLEEQYLEPPSDESDAAWNGMLPNGDGFFIIENPKEYGLQIGLPSRTGKGDTKFGTVWSHQHHCLIIMREEYWKLLRNQSDLVGLEEDPNWMDNNKWAKHVNHCYDYIRKTILCNMDMNIEYPVPVKGQPPHISGNGVLRTCKNTEPVFEFWNQHLDIIDA
ncbi:hypothetical protein V502_06531 [Pseudogymnoascus sp. VKM F-4520 (FW-2644)]|nr:hypothetical protein V502_06531 [Pseudogymnoascus sp. VKM F-4520 (FW-2644)]